MFLCYRRQVHCATIVAAAYTQDESIDKYKMVECSALLEIETLNGPHEAFNEVVASFLNEKSVLAALMCIFTIAAKYIAQLAASHTHVDSVGDNFAQYDASACTFKLDLIRPSTRL